MFGIGAPNNTPIEVVDKLNENINASLADPKSKAQLAELGGTVLVGSPADFGKLIAEETEKWGKVVRGPTLNRIRLTRGIFHNHPFCADTPRHDINEPRAQ